MERDDVMRETVKQWKHTDDESRLFPTRRTDQPTCKKFRWFKLLSTPAGVAAIGGGS